MVRAGRCRPIGAGWAICLLAALPATAQLRVAEPPANDAGIGILEVELDPAEVTVGDRIEARLILVWTGPTPAPAPRFPEWRDGWGEAEVHEAGEVEEVAVAGVRRVYRQRLVLTAFNTGELRLPPVTVTVPLPGDVVEVEGAGDAGFTVRSVLPEDARELEPRPPSPPRRLATDRRFAWTVAILGGLCLVAAWGVARRLRAPAEAVEVPAAEPLPELMQLLQQLDPTAVEPAHTGLSRGLRRFLSRSLGFPAAESTTTEIDRRLRRIRVGRKTADEMVRLLRDCDRAKFARMPVPVQETRQRLRQARDLGYRIDRRHWPAASDGASVPPREDAEESP